MRLGVGGGASAERSPRAALRGANIGPVKGRLVFVMHAHLPYVLGHGEWPYGASWLFEAAADTYLPLLGSLEALQTNGVRPALTLEFTPVLGEQLDDDRFRTGLVGHLTALIDAAIRNRDDAAASGDAERVLTAEAWRDRYQATLGDFERRDRDILSGFGALDAAGAIELFTCARTHGFLPLLGSAERIRRQIGDGVEWFQARFGRKPRGMWMPECAYRPGGPWQPAAGLPPDGERPGVEAFLQAAGIDWTIIDAHLVTAGAPIGNYPPWSAAAGEGLSPHQIYALGDSMVAAFPRDPTTTVQVWSGDIGYPANPWFLEFHRRHHEGGLRYWRVTDRELDIGEKAPYEPGRADAAVAEQGHHFARLVGETIANTVAAGVENPVVLAPYDAELFGHWWREGVEWFAAARRELDAAGITVATASEALDTVGAAQAVRVPAGSWGDGGDFRVWDVPSTADLWRAIYAAEAGLEQAQAEDSGPERTLRTVLDQLRRTVLLIESSDWAFLISTGTAVEYATERWRGHAADAAFLTGLAGQLAAGSSLDAEQERDLADLVERDRVWLP